MKFLNLVLLSLITIFFSCSQNDKSKNYKQESINGIQYIRNKNVPKYSNCQLKLEPVFKIKGVDSNFDSLRTFTNPSIIKVDKDENLYICDTRTLSIKKFNKNGEFITSFSKSGTGPGEMRYINDFLIHKDTIYVYGDKDKINKFNLSGKFLNRQFVKLSNVFSLSNFISLNDSLFLLKSLCYKKIGKKDMKIFRNVSIFDYNFVLNKNIDSTSISAQESNREPFKYIALDPIIAASNKQIYVSYPNKEAYQIMCYDFSGIIKAKITKNYSMVPFPASYLDKMRKETQAEINRKMFDYTPAIISLHTDKNDNLWAYKGDKFIDGDNYYDIFSKEGIFLTQYAFGTENKQNIDLLKKKNIVPNFLGDFLVIVDKESLEVHGYKYELEMQEK